MKTRNELTFIKQEELQSEIDILERVIISYEKAVYENIGQILSLAKWQLGSIDLKKTNDSQHKINNSRKLIGKSIHDLCQVSKQPGPKDIFKNGFADAIAYELSRMKNSHFCEMECYIAGSFFKLDKGMELIIFSILQELVHNILLLQINRLFIKIYYLANEILVKIIYQKRNLISVEKELMNANLKIINRVKLIGAELSIENLENNSTICLKIKV